MNKPAIAESGARARMESPSYVGAEQLLEILFHPDCRPTVRWLRKQQANKKLPHVKMGRLVFFDPVACREAINKTGQILSRPRTHGKAAA